jgi:hypothetical protein
MIVSNGETFQQATYGSPTHQVSLIIPERDAYYNLTKLCQELETSYGEIRDLDPCWNMLVRKIERDIGMLRLFVN